MRSDRKRLPGRLPALLLAATLMLAAIWGPAPAFERYNDGCQSCHGQFTGPTSPKGTVFPGDDKHRMHRAANFMNVECDLCHSTGDGNDPFIGSSDGTASNPGLGCTGCHQAFGLRLYHTNNGIGSCQNCHDQDGTPPPESALPMYYGILADSNVDEPCNLLMQANANENWSVGDFDGVDNDGDGLRDGADPDCQAGGVCGNGMVESGEECDDGNTLGGDCCSATCSFEPSGQACDDGQFCSVGETCDGAGSCGGAGARDCDDGIGCTLDSCDETGDQCLNNADDAACDDTQFCNGSETCDPVNDCQAGTPVNCNDGNICTDDSCNEGTDSCDNTFNPSNDPSCMPGACGNGVVETGEECDDGNVVDGDCCSSTCGFEPSGQACDDGLFCSVGETCDGGGICAGATARDCSDGVGCTVDSCNESASACENVPDDGQCDDGMFCNGPETCDAVQDCRPGAPVNCDDADICTDDACNEAASRCDNILDVGNDPTCFDRCADVDGDLVSPDGGGCGPIDCDDDDDEVFAGAAENCDDYKDNDCNGLVDAADTACDDEDDDWQVRRGPLQDPAYAGSEACADCHEELFEAWSETLHARLQIPPGDAQAAGFALPDSNSIPGSTVTLNGWNDVLFVLGQKWRTHYVDRGGILQDIRWDFRLGRWVPDTGGDYDCGACHTTGYDASAVFTDDQDRPVNGIVGSWVEYNIGCEACHGPGAEHAAEPSRQNINRIVLDWTDTGEGMRTPSIRSAEVCGNCHYRPPSHEGITDPMQRNQEQFNDWSAGPHVSTLEPTAVNTYCAKCHSPGNALMQSAEHFFEGFEPSAATHVTCISCHDPHGVSRQRFATLEWPPGGVQDPRRLQAALARYLGSDRSVATRDYRPLADGASQELCTDCHVRQPGFRRHVDAGPPEEVVLAPPFNQGELFTVPHLEHVELGRADCVDCHMSYSRTSSTTNDVRTHSFLPNELGVGGRLHYNETCGRCHDEADDCSWCHSEFSAIDGSGGGRGEGSTEDGRNRSSGRTDWSGRRPASRADHE